jgi:hypothetical protein
MPLGLGRFDAEPCCNVMLQLRRHAAALAGGWRHRWVRPAVESAQVVERIARLGPTLPSSPVGYRLNEEREMGLG